MPSRGADFYTTQPARHPSEQVQSVNGNTPSEDQPRSSLSFRSKYIGKLCAHSFEGSQCSAQVRCYWINYRLSARIPYTSTPHQHPVRKRNQKQSVEQSTKQYASTCGNCVHNQRPRANFEMYPPTPLTVPPPFYHEISP